MHEHLDALERRMQQLQQAIRQAQAQHDQTEAARLRQELKRTQKAWDVLLGSDDEQPEQAPLQPRPAPVASRWGGRPVGEQGHQVLTLLTVPAAPRLLSQVHEAFLTGPLNTARLNTLRRDEKNSYRAT